MHWMNRALKKYRQTLSVLWCVCVCVNGSVFEPFTRKWIAKQNASFYEQIFHTKLMVMFHIHYFWLMCMWHTRQTTVWTDERWTAYGKQLFDIDCGFYVPSILNKVQSLHSAYISHCPPSLCTHTYTIHHPPSTMCLLLDEVANSFARIPICYFSIYSIHIQFWCCCWFFFPPFLRSLRFIYMFRSICSLFMSQRVCISTAVSIQIHHNCPFYSLARSRSLSVRPSFSHKQCVCYICFLLCQHQHFIGEQSFYFMTYAHIQHLKWS